MDQRHQTLPLQTAVSADHSAAGVLACNRVLRNTYLLLAMTLMFSALAAGAAAALKLRHPGLVITLVGYFGLLFLTTRFRDSALGLAFVFALTGFMSYTLGPIISAYLQPTNGALLVMTAMGATGAIILGLSGLRAGEPPGLQLSGRFPHGRHPGGLPGRTGRDLLRDSGALAHRFCDVRAGGVGPDSVPDQRHHRRLRNQVHHGHGDLVRLNLQPLHHHLLQLLGFTNASD
jgi:hypothetical protein